MFNLIKEIVFSFLKFGNFVEYDLENPRPKSLYILYYKFKVFLYSKTKYF